MTKTYPKNAIRRVIKTHEPNHNLSKTADVLVLPPFLTFMLITFTGVPRLRAVYEGVDEGG
jgi:hypothetical protein